MSYRKEKFHPELKRMGKKLLILYGANPQKVEYEKEFDLPNEKKIIVDVYGLTNFGSTVIECGTINNERLGLLSKIFDKVIWLPFNMELPYFNKFSDMVNHIDELNETITKLESEIKGLRGQLELCRFTNPKSDSIEELYMTIKNAYQVLEKYKESLRRQETKTIQVL